MSTENNLPQFQIQKIYVKDLSFTIPEPNKVWNNEWQPQLKTDLNVEAINLPEDNTYETTLKVNIEVTSNDVKAFEVEVKQSGIFTAINMSEEQIEHAKHSFCANVIYHYAREVISDLVVNGGFPQLCLSPINFDAMYFESKQENSEK